MAGYIHEFAHIHGTPSNPVVIDGGGDLVDGKYDAIPIYMHDCSHVRLVNWDICNSRGSVLWAPGNRWCTFEQIVAWNANPDKNFNPYSVSGSTDCLVLDCAGFGSGRKIFGSSQGGDRNAFVRCYGRWEMSRCEGWKMVFAIAYNNTDCLFRDCIGEYKSLPDSAREFRGVFADDRIDGGGEARTIVSRCLANVSGNTKGFNDSLTRGITFDRCVTRRGSVDEGDSQYAIDIQSVWRQSPILARLREHGIDVLRLLTPTPGRVDADITA